jgi:hypothetical protein
MQNCNNVNRFFVDKIYKNTVDFGLFPISWAFKSVNANQPSYLNKGMLFFFAPFFFEAAATTIALASVVLIPSLIAHAIALVTAALIDISQQQPVQLNNRQFQNFHTNNFAASY